MTTEKDSTKKAPAKPKEAKVTGKIAAGLIGLDGNRTFAVNKKFKNAEPMTLTEWKKVFKKVKLID